MLINWLTINLCNVWRKRKTYSIKQWSSLSIKKVDECLMFFTRFFFGKSDGKRKHVYYSFIPYKMTCEKGNELVPCDLTFLLSYVCGQWRLACYSFTLKKKRLVCCKWQEIIIIITIMRTCVEPCVVKMSSDRPCAFCSILRKRQFSEDICLEFMAENISIPMLFISEIIMCLHHTKRRHFMCK